MKMPRMLLIVCSLWTGLVSAQVETLPPPATSPPPPTSMTEPPKVVTKESTIYVPFERLEEVFEGQEQGVFLPYREFLEMWNKLNVPEKLKKVEPPVTGILASAQYAGRVEGDLAELAMKLNFEALKEGWSALKLGSELALTEVKSTAILNAGSEGHEVIFPNKGAYALEGKVFGRVVRDKGRAVLALKLPKTAVSQFELVIPEKGLEFSVTPASAFSAVEQETGTKLSAYFGASQEVAISWLKKGGETALPPLLFADVAMDVRVSAGAVRTTATVASRILRAGVNVIDVTVPEDQQVLAVEGANIKEWKVTPAAGGQLVHVELHTPAKDSYQFHLKLEAALPALPQKPKLPAIAVQKVERQTGSVTVTADGELVIEPSDLQGLTQQAVVAGKDGNAASGVIGMYRYLRLPYSGTLNVSEAKPQIEVTSRTALIVGMDSLKLEADFTYVVKRSGVFSVAMELPAGVASAEARGDAVESSAATVIDGKPVLTVKFKQRQLGTIAFHVSGESNRSKADDAVTAPMFRPLGVDRHSAKVGLGIHVSLKANTTERGDFVEEDINNLDGLTVADARTPLTLGFRYRTHQDQAAAPAKVAFELRKPRVSAEVLALVDVREALTHYEWHLHYAVEFAGVNEFTFEVPKAIADELKIDGAQIRERVRSDAKGADGQPNGLVEWRVVLQDRILGGHQLMVNYDVARGEQKPGAEVPVALPELKATGVFRETGQVAIFKDGNLEFTKTDVAALEAIDPKELNPVLQRDGVFLAYKYSQHPIGLTLSVSKNFYLEVPQAVVTFADITSVIAEDEAETTEIVYWIKNNSQQFLSVQLPTRGGIAARLLSDAFVAGEPQQPSKRPDKNEVLIRLPAKQKSEGEFAVRFIYELPSSRPGKKLGWRGSFDVQPPQVAGVKVLQTKWSFYLPQDYRYVGFGGAMHEVQGERLWERMRRRMLVFTPQPGPPPPDQLRPTFSNPQRQVEAGNAGFDTPLRKEGLRVELRRMEAPALVSVNYRGKGYAYFVEAIAGLLAFAGGIVLLRQSALHRWRYFLVIGLGALVVSGVVNPRAASLWHMIWLGTLGAAGVWVGLAIFRWMRALAAKWAANRAARPAASGRVEPTAPSTPVPTAPGNLAQEPPAI